MYTKAWHMGNRTLGIAIGKMHHDAQKLYALQWFRKTHAQYIGDDAEATCATIGVLRCGKRIQVVTHKRTHITQRIA